MSFGLAAYVWPNCITRLRAAQVLFCQPAAPRPLDGTQ